MRIAYISFEHPAGISGGGIGTYIGQISRLMTSMGHEVEVFSGTTATPGTIDIDGYTLHLIRAESTAEFRTAVIQVFSPVHDTRAFDLIESPEYGADALEIKKKYPGLPMTVKLHTPRFLISELNNYRNGIFHKIRFIAGGIRRGRIVKPYWRYDRDDDEEYALFKLADSVSSPSQSLAKLISKKWHNNQAIPVIPYPFDLREALFGLAPPSPGKHPFKITFIGRLEKRKGILVLIAAIPAVLKNLPGVLFRFVGQALPSPIKDTDMAGYLRRKLRNYSPNLELLGFQSYEHLPDILDDTDICIFPSLWENFPNVCLEAMAAGRVVIGTDNGGMADMIESGVSGILVPPGSAKAITSAIRTLAAQPEKIPGIGKAARKRIVEYYNSDRIGRLTESHYRQTITGP